MRRPGSRTARKLYFDIIIHQINDKGMKVLVVGTGYVGLVTGTCLAETGAMVYCVDINQEKIDKLNKGILPIYEPGLDEIVERNVEKERLYFTTRVADVIEDCDVIFIAVGTPPGEDGSADLNHVIGVARDIGKSLNHYAVVVTKSTVPVGTASRVKKAIQAELDARGSDVAFDVASNPEFLKEGNAVDDFMKPDRIVVGVESEKAEKVLERLYKPFLLNGHPLIFMDITSSEMTKYAANAMLATKISFINDIANLCEIVGADINHVRRGIGSDPRIGPKFIYPGVGYGGSCFPKDVKALIRTARDFGYDLRLLDAVEKVNNDQKHVMTKKILNHFDGNLDGKKFAMWGLSFKPGTDDMREAPSLVLIDDLLKAGASVIAYDPVAMGEAKAHYLEDRIQYAGDMYEAAIGADALVLVTEWNEFRIPNYRVLEKLMNRKVLFDGRNIFDPADAREHGFVYYGIGRK